MLPHQCPVCGLENIPERTLCKRCRAQLRAPRAEVFQRIGHAQLTVRGGVASGFPWLFPIQRFTIASDHAVGDVQRMLRQAFAGVIVRTSGTGWFTIRCTYLGSLLAERVHVRGPYGYRQWSLDAEGVLQATEDGSVIQLTVQPTRASIAMMIFFFGTWLGITLLMTGGSWFFLWPCAVRIGLYGIIIARLRSEASDIATLVAGLLTPHSI